MDCHHIRRRGRTTSLQESIPDDPITRTPVVMTTDNGENMLTHVAIEPDPAMALPRKSHEGAKEMIDSTTRDVFDMNNMAGLKEFVVEECRT